MATLQEAFDALSRVLQAERSRVWTLSEMATRAGLSESVAAEALYWLTADGVARLCHREGVEFWCAAQQGVNNG